MLGAPSILYVGILYVFFVGSVPSQQGKLPTEWMALENYLEIGNGLPNRKKCFGELFGPVMGMKSVMN